MHKLLEDLELILGFLVKLAPLFASAVEWVWSKLKRGCRVAFRLPVFNLTANAWTTDTVPDAGEPEITGLEGQLYVPSRGAIDITPGSDPVYVPPIYFRYPIATDPPRLYYVECPAGSGVYFRVRWTSINHQGFSNEYWSAVVEYCASDGTPVYFPGETVPPPPDPPNCPCCDDVASPASFWVRVDSPGYPWDGDVIQLLLTVTEGHCQWKRADESFFGLHVIVDSDSSFAPNVTVEFAYHTSPDNDPEYLLTTLPYGLDKTCDPWYFTCHTGLKENGVDTGDEVTITVVSPP